MLFNMNGVQYRTLLFLHTLQPLKGDFSKLASGLLVNSQESTISQGKQKLTTKDALCSQSLEETSNETMEISLWSSTSSRGKAEWQGPISSLW